MYTVIIVQAHFIVEQLFCSTPNAWMMTTSHFVPPPHTPQTAHSHSSTLSHECGQSWDTLSGTSEISSTPYSTSISRLSHILPSVVPKTPPSTISPSIHNVKRPTPTAVPVTTCAFQWLPVTPRHNMNTMPILLLSHINAQYSLITYLFLLLFWLTVQFRQVTAIHWPPLVPSDHLRFVLHIGQTRSPLTLHLIRLSAIYTSSYTLYYLTLLSNACVMFLDSSFMMQSSEFLPMLSVPMQMCRRRCYIIFTSYFHYLHYMSLCHSVSNPGASCLLFYTTHCSLQHIHDHFSLHFVKFFIPTIN